MTEQLHFHFSLSCTGEGNDNPLQCSCLENPRDGGSLVGCHLWSRTESDTTSNLAYLEIHPVRMSLVQYSTMQGDKGYAMDSLYHIVKEKSCKFIIV